MELRAQRCAPRANDHLGQRRASEHGGLCVVVGGDGAIVVHHTVEHLQVAQAGEVVVEVDYGQEQQQLVAVEQRRSIILRQKVVAGQVPPAHAGVWRGSCCGLPAGVQLQQTLQGVPEVAERGLQRVQGDPEVVDLQRVRAQRERNKAVRCGLDDFRRCARRAGSAAPCRVERRVLNAGEQGLVH